MQEKEGPKSANFAKDPRVGPYDVMVRADVIG